MASRHHNLSNPASDPVRAAITVTCTVCSDLISAVPKAKLQQWLESLPENARVTYDGISSGRVRLAASWTEER